ncbi:MAG: WecB/TagA/CpsF family glycosyltransferase [Actinomycetota bacterium]
MTRKDRKAGIASGCFCPPLRTHAWVNGVRVDTLSPSEALERLGTFLSCSASHVVNHLPAHPTVIARRDPVYRDLLNRADLNVADGMGVVWACRLQGFRRMQERVYGPDFLLEAFRWGEDRGIRHTFVGGTENTLDLLIQALRRRYPRVRVQGAYAPPFRDVNEESVQEDLSRLNVTADLLWVGLGTPKQQVWADIARNYSPAKAILTVGAAYDFIAGVKPQAPRWMQRHGLEWAFRLATEPRRLWRRALVDNAVFAWAVLMDRGFGPLPGPGRRPEHDRT